MARRLRPQGGVIALAVAFACLAAAGHVPAEDTADKGPRCTISGADGPDVLRGTRSSDVICGAGGGDAIRGKGGDDVIRGGGGDDRLKGQAADDLLVGGAGDDRLDGGRGRNGCRPGGGADVLRACAASPDEVIADVEVYGLNVTPEIVDTSGGPSEIAVSARIVSRDVDIREVGAIASLSPFGLRAGQSLDLTSGSRRDGIWEGRIALRQYSPTGEYEVRLGVGTKAREGFEWPPERGHFRQVGWGDAGPPVLQHVDVSPDTIDTSGEPARVRVEARITDDFLGASQVSMFFDHQPLQLSRHSVWYSTLLHRESGDARDATYVGYVELPRHARQGRYRLATVQIDDEIGQTSPQYDAYGPDHDPIVEFEQVGPGDSDRPTLGSFALSHTVIDKSEGGAAWAEVAAGDSLSGIDEVMVEFVPLDDRWATGNRLALSSGTPHDGVWNGSVGGSYYPLGEYKVELWVRDGSQNTIAMSSADLAAAGYPNRITIVP